MDEHICVTCKYKEWFPACCLDAKPSDEDILIYCKAYESEDK